MKIKHTLVLIISSLTLALSVFTQAAPSEPYNWQNVRIDGGGFVPGIVFNRSEPNLIYARTDIGGAYRWDETDQRWIPLLDWVGWDNWNLNGVTGLATDPVDPDRVYVSLGMYTNDWDPYNGAIARSTDRGATWQLTELPFKIGGNMPGRGVGERLAIDPNDNSTLYFGAEVGEGLWRSTDFGATWSNVSNFPNPGNFAPDPTSTNPYLTKELGVVWVTFDGSSGSASQGSQVIYVGVADLNESLYRSTDGGATWEAIPGAPSGFLPHKGVYDDVNDVLYVAMSDASGPYDGDSGAVWKFEATSGTWTEISPVSGADLNYGYSGLTLDRQNPGTLMVSSVNAWWPEEVLFRSTDSGTTWTRIWDYGLYPERIDRYTMDISSVPWLTFGKTNADYEAPEQTPKLGWMIESMEIDPHNPDRFMYGTGATIFGSTNLTDLDTDTGTVVIKPMIKGLEETAVRDLASPPSGTANIFSALGDIGGFKHTDLEAVPPMMFNDPYITSTMGIDFAELDPNVMVRVGNGHAGHIGVSRTAGDSWFQPAEPADVTGGGKVAMSADGNTIVWSPDGTGVHYSTDDGATWSASNGVPAGARVESDRVNPDTFYAFADGNDGSDGGTASNAVFYISTDGGANFSASGATGLPLKAHFVATPGLEGHIWLAGEGLLDRDGAVLTDSTKTGLWRSTDGGASFSRLASVEAGLSIGLGAAASGSTYHTLYLVGRVDGVIGVYRSIDEGANWVRINDDQHQYGNMGQSITGDPRIFGRVYLGTDGRGLLYADPTGEGVGNQDPTAAASATPTSGQAPLNVVFDGSDSSDPDGDGLSYSWSFGDGASATGISVSHTYEAEGNHTATLTVSDGNGGTDTASVAIEVSGSGGSGGPYFSIANRNSGKCVDVDGALTDNDANIVQYDCLGTDNQQFEWNDLGNGYHQLVAKHSGKCIRASNGDVFQYDCHDHYWTEMFERIDAGNGYYILKNRNTGSCLRVENSSGSNGANIVLASCNTGWWSQQFSFE